MVICHFGAIYDGIEHGIFSTIPSDRHSRTAANDAADILQMLAASRQSFALYVLVLATFRTVRLSINARTQCARWCSSIFGCALPHEQVYQDAR